MKRLHLFITGYVQGVGFRAWCKRLAVARELTGWVTNREDGTVEIVVEGPQLQLTEFVSLCRTGSTVAEVETLDISWEPATGEFQTFSIVY